jgi:hypothetical protein
VNDAGDSLVDPEQEMWTRMKFVRATADEPEITEMFGRYRDYFSGGFGSRSIPEGSRSSETPLPVRQPVKTRDAAGVPTAWFPPQSGDETDRLAKHHMKGAVHAAMQMERWARVFISHKSWFTVKPKPIEDDPVIPCGNNDCGDALEVGRKSGECDKCRRHRSRHGLAWPKLPHDAEVAS